MKSIKYVLIFLFCSSCGLFYRGEIVPYVYTKKINDDGAWFVNTFLHKPEIPLHIYSGNWWLTSRNADFTVFEYAKKSTAVSTKTLTVHDTTRYYLATGAEESFWTHYEFVRDETSDSIYLKKDTFDLQMKDRLSFIYEDKTYHLSKMESALNDSACMTLYFSDSLGLIKRYSTVDKWNEELYLLSDADERELLIAHFDTLKQNLQFHTKCNGGARWVGEELLDPLPREHKSASQEVEDLIRATIIDRNTEGEEVKKKAKEKIGNN